MARSIEDPGQLELSSAMAARARRRAAWLARIGPNGHQKLPNKYPNVEELDAHPSEGFPAVGDGCSVAGGEARMST